MAVAEGLAELVATRPKPKDDTAQKTARNVLFIKAAIDDVVKKLSDVTISNLKDDVKITNLDEIHLQLRKELSRTVKALEKGLKFDKQPLLDIKKELSKHKSVTVDNLSDIKIPEVTIPDTVKINNLSDIKAYFDQLSSVIKETFGIEIPPPLVTVNVPEVAPPIVTVKPPDLSALLSALAPLALLSQSPDSPLAVRLSDGVRFAEVIREVVDNQKEQIIAYGKSDSMNAKEFRSSSRALSQKTAATSNTKVNVLAASTPVVSKNVDRVSLTLSNDSDETIYISKSATAVMNQGIRLNAQGGVITISDYTGAVAAISASGTKNLTVCEV